MNTFPSRTNVSSVSHNCINSIHSN